MDKAEVGEDEHADGADDQQEDADELAEEDADAPAEEDVDGEEAEQADTDAAGGGEAEGHPEAGQPPPQKRPRGRPRKVGGAAPPPRAGGPRRKPGRPSNSELLARFANSHRAAGSPLLPEPELGPGPRGGRGRGRRGRRGGRRGGPGSRGGRSLSRLRAASRPGARAPSGTRGLHAHTFVPFL